MKATNTCFLIVYSIRSLVRFSKPINIFLLAMYGKRTLVLQHSNSVVHYHHYATFSTLNNPFAMGNELPPKLCTLYKIVVICLENEILILRLFEFLEACIASFKFQKKGVWKDLEKN